MLHMQQSPTWRMTVETPSLLHLLEADCSLDLVVSHLESELKEFSDLQKKAYSDRLQKSIVGLENRIQRIKKSLYTN